MNIVYCGIVGIINENLYNLNNGNYFKRPKRIVD